MKLSNLYSKYIEKNVELSAVLSSSLSAQVSSYVKDSVPTKISDLTNDVEYQTSTDVYNAVKDKANASDLSSHTSNTEEHVSSDDRSNWNAKLDSSDLNGYASTEYVDASLSSKQDSIDEEHKLPYSYLSGIPAGQDVPVNVSDLNNDLGFITASDLSGKQDVIDASNKLPSAYVNLPTLNRKTIQIKNGDLSAGSMYVWTTATSNKIFQLSSLLSSYITESKLNSKGYLTSEDLPPMPSNLSDLNDDIGIVRQEDIPPVPTYISDLNNDVGFITMSDLPTVNNATLTITQGSNSWTFSANASENVTINLGSSGGSSEGGITLAQARRQALIFG